MCVITKEEPNNEINKWASLFNRLLITYTIVNSLCCEIDVSLFDVVTQVRHVWSHDIIAKWSFSYG